MARKIYKPEEIVNLLRQVEVADAARPLPYTGRGTLLPTSAARKQRFVAQKAEVC
jgi:hypothetical protein